MTKEDKTFELYEKTNEIDKKYESSSSSSGLNGLEDMSDLISRKALIKDIEKGMQENPHTNEKSRTQHALEYRQFLHIASRQPTIEAKPVVYAEWIGQLQTGILDEWYCSNCHKLADTRDKRQLGNFCSGCGANMRKKVEDNE